MIEIERTEWVAALSLRPLDGLAALLEEVCQGWQIRPKTLPQSGLGIMKMRESALNQGFYLGEFPLATAWLELELPDGQRAEGAAQVLDDREALAEALALCDAILANRLPGWQKVATELAEGERLRQLEARKRKAMLARSRVDFNLLDAVDDDED